MATRLMSAVLLLALLALVGCGAVRDPAKAAKARQDATAILHSLQKPDMLRYRALTLPPAERQRLQQEWPQIRRRLALDAGEQANFDKLLLRFTEPQAEAHLQRDLNAKIKPLKSEIDSKWPLMKASLTLLMQGWIESNNQLSASEKAHGKALVKAIVEQMPADWLQDKVLRERAFAQMVRIARDSGVRDYRQYSSLGYVDFHRRMSGFLGGLKTLGKIYGLDWNAGQARLDITVIKQSGNTATVRVRYPLGKKWVEFPMDMIERNGQWFDASAAALLHDTLAEP